MSTELWVLAFTVAALAIGVLIRIGLGHLGAALSRLTKGLVDKQALDVVGEAIAASAQRAKDKFLAEILAAREAGSDGGVEVTPGELSKARAYAFEILMDGLRGPAKEAALALGPNLLKGMIGIVLDKLVKPKLVTSPT